MRNREVRDTLNFAEWDKHQKLSELVWLEVSQQQLCEPSAAKSRLRCQDNVLKIRYLGTSFPSGVGRNMAGAAISRMKRSRHAFTARARRQHECDLQHIRKLERRVVVTARIYKISTKNQRSHGEPRRSHYGRIGENSANPPLSGFLSLSSRIMDVIPTHAAIQSTFTSGAANLRHLPFLT
jgi:hypothetical protein